MGILDEDVARVREATDIVGLIGEHVALKRSGARFTGLCPFHGEKTPSFSVNPQLGFYYCFGCQESGDAITFVRKIDGLDFAEAVERLAVRAGITLRYDTAGATQDRRKRERLTEAVQEAQDCFRARLMFPIYDRAGKAVGFGGRTLTDDGPKYKNTAESALYHKSRLLYGLNWAKAEIGARDEVVICEGYTDVMGFTL